MSDQHVCADCGQALEKGFLPDQANAGAIRQIYWHAGEPTENHFLGFKLDYKLDGSQMASVTAWRCTGCGLLKFYACS